MIPRSVRLAVFPSTAGSPVSQPMKFMNCVCVSPRLVAYALIVAGAGVQCSYCARVAGLSEYFIIFSAESIASSTPSTAAAFGQLVFTPAYSVTSSVKAAALASTWSWR